MKRMRDIGRHLYGARLTSQKTCARSEPAIALS